MITLCQFPSLCKETPFTSPFGLQVETYLRMTELPHEVRYVLDPRQGPKGQLPYIVDEDRKIGDAMFILEYLKHRYGDPLDSRLTREQTHQHVRLQRLLEGSLYWVLIYSRWVDETGWKTLSTNLAAHLPPGICHVIPRLMRAKVRRELEVQGLGLRPPEWVYGEGAQDLEMLSRCLGEREYLLGSRPSSIDAMAFGALANILYIPGETQLKTLLSPYPNLTGYCTRIVGQYFADKVADPSVRAIAA